MMQHPLSPSHLLSLDMQGINVEAGSFYLQIKECQGGIPVYFIEFAADSTKESASFGAFRENQNKVISGEMIIEECLGINLDVYSKKIFNVINLLKQSHPLVKKIAIHFLRGRSTKRILEKIVAPLTQNQNIVDAGHQIYSLKDNDTTYFGGYKPEAISIYQKEKFDLVIGIGIFCSLSPTINPGDVFILDTWHQVSLDDFSIAGKGSILNDTELAVIHSLNLPTITLGGTISGFYDFRKYLSNKTTFGIFPPDFSKFTLWPTILSSISDYSAFQSITRLNKTIHELCENVKYDIHLRFSTSHSYLEEESDICIGPLNKNQYRMTVYTTPGNVIVKTIATKKDVVHIKENKIRAVSLTLANKQLVVTGRKCEYRISFKNAHGITDKDSALAWLGKNTILYSYPGLKPLAAVWALVEHDRIGLVFLIKFDPDLQTQLEKEYKLVIDINRWKEERALTKK